MTISFLEILLRLGLALILGAIIGLERESTEHTAGMRTQALVALGSALFTIISAFGFTSFLGVPHIQIDPTRIASYIVAGIGFLGAGSIFRDQDRVRGLTTAASVWLVAAVGMACGAGFLLVAVTATIMALIVLIFLRSVEKFPLLRQVERLLSPGRSLEAQHLHIEATSITGQFTGQVYDACIRSGITVEKLTVRPEQGVETVVVTCHIPDSTTLAQIIDELRALPEVHAVHADLRSTDTKQAIPKDTADKAS
ncbi:MAG TPA: MgtC/SapB family protein [Ktedonobacteraceae bacterium]|nr:MgtC/SapB family protein [Ktedonobacteraceae bacterium]